MVDNAYYTPEFHGEYELVGIGRLDLEEGGSIEDCQLAVTTFGTLNEAKDNAIGTDPGFMPQLDRHLGELLAG